MPDSSRAIRTMFYQRKLTIGVNLIPELRSITIRSDWNGTQSIDFNESNYTWAYSVEFRDCGLYMVHPKGIMP
jgi:hypothetical protein